MSDKQAYCYWLSVANTRKSAELNRRAMSAISKARTKENKEKKLEKALLSSPLVVSLLKF